MSLTVSEILALEELSAMRLRAGKQGLQLAVRWYYVAENENIAEWIMGGELVFITGINHPRDEDNLVHLLMEGKQRGIAGMVILTGDAYIQAIPPRLIALADELGIPLIEQPYLLKMVIVTERIGTALVRSENALQSQRDILLQLLTGDFPDLQILQQRALHQQLDFTRPLRVVALRLEGIQNLFRQFPPEQAEAWLQQARRIISQRLQQQLNQQDNPYPLVERSNMFIFLLPDEDGEFYQQKNWLAQWLFALAEGDDRLSLLCGLSARVQQLQDYQRALSQARQALDLSDTLRPAQRITDYQQLGFIKLLSAIGDPALLSDFMHDTLVCLIERDRKSPWLLMETLETLLQENGNVVRAAERLGIHRNTLHQRIQRIEKLTSYPISHPQFHLNASVALTIWRMSQNHLREYL
ncbi:PucR family transcriptional regulator [Phytobacter ursingii]